MNICEALKKADKKDWLLRKSVDLRLGFWMDTLYVFTNYFMIWHPRVEDLTADDWEIEQYDAEWLTMLIHNQKCQK